MGAGFKPEASTDELVLYVDRLANVELPDWIHINYLSAPEHVGLEAHRMKVPSHQVLEDSIIRLVTSTLGKKPGSINPNEALLSSPTYFDSFALMELVLRLEDTFCINIPDEDLDPDIFHSVNTIASYLRMRLKQGD